MAHGAAQVAAEVGQTLGGRLARPGAQVQKGRAAFGAQGQAGPAAESEVVAAGFHVCANFAAAVFPQRQGFEPGPSPGHDEGGGGEGAQAARFDRRGIEKGEGRVQGLQGAVQKQAPEVGFVPQDGQVCGVTVHTRPA